MQKKKSGKSGVTRHAGKMINFNITIEHISFVQNAANKVSKTATEGNLKKKRQEGKSQPKQ